MRVYEESTIHLELTSEEATWLKDYTQTAIREPEAGLDQEMRRRFFLAMSNVLSELGSPIPRSLNLEV